MFDKVLTTGRMIKLSHSVFALPFALVAVFLACKNNGQKWPDAGRLVLWLVCMVSARAFAMMFNRIADAKLDAANPRTAGRELPTGKVSACYAWGFMFGCGAVFAAACAAFWFFYSNMWPVVFGLPVLVFLAGYSYAKRFTVLSHFWLGASLGIAPLASWVVFSVPQGPLMAWPAVALGVAVMFWTAGFDIIYALADIDFDRRMRLHSIPAAVGAGKALWISRGCHALTLAVLATLLYWPWFCIFYTAALALAAAAFFVEHWLISRSIANVNAAFFTVNGCFSIVFAALAILDIISK